MVTWWNFSTHIFTQFAHLLLVGAVVLFWRLHAHQPAGRAAPHPNTRRWLARAGLCCLQLLVYLGHFGFWMNTTLLGGVVLIMLMIAVLRRRADGGVARTLLWGFIAAQVISVGLFYSAYAGLFLGQARAAAAGGLTGLAGRAAIPFNVLWNTLWDAGLRVHFGFFPVPLALSGLLLVWRRAADRERQRAHRSETRGEPAHAVRVSILPALMAGTFLIGICFAVLPFLTGSSLATRWLMFSAWAIAIGAAVAAQRFWRAGLAGRMLVVAIGGYMLWITASQWLAALAWRVRPPEPF